MCASQAPLCQGSIFARDVETLLRTELLKSEALYLKKPYVVALLLIVTSSLVAIEYYGNSIFIDRSLSCK